MCPAALQLEKFTLLFIQLIFHHQPACTTAIYLLIFILFTALLKINLNTNLHTAVANKKFNFYMKRRHFIKNTSLAGFTIPALVAATSATAHATGNQDADNTQAGNAFSVVEATIDDLQRLMERNQLTSKQLTALYLKRIEAVDKTGPAINSVIENKPRCALYCRSIG